MVFFVLNLYDLFASYCSVKVGVKVAFALPMVKVVVGKEGLLTTAPVSVGAMVHPLKTCDSSGVATIRAEVPGTIQTGEVFEPFTVNVPPVTVPKVSW